MDNKIYDYARVSSREQNEDRQIEALKTFRVPSENVIINKCSGKDTERDGYQYLKRQIFKNGDTLVIKELDHLSRNKNDIKQELEYFKFAGIHIKILDIPTTLTDFPVEQMWVMNMINAILIDVLGSIAENERNKTGLILTNLLGGYVQPRTFKDYYNQILGISGIRHFTFHALRHTFATRALEQNMESKTLSSILEHYSVTFTLDTYAHVFDSQKRESMKLIEEFCISPMSPQNRTYPIVVTAGRIHTECCGF